MMNLKVSQTVGYSRVSTHDQDLTLQLDALRPAGCAEDHLFVDQASGAKTDRPGLDACLAALEAGDTLLVWRLDRLGRSSPTWSSWWRISASIDLQGFFTPKTGCL